VNLIRRLRRLAVFVVLLELTSFAVAQTVTMTLTTPSKTYVAGGGTVILTASIAYSVQPSAIGGSIFLPPGWSLASVGGKNSPNSTPDPGTTQQIDYAYFSFPSGSAQFTVVLNYPAGLTGPQTITSSFQYRSPTQNLTPIPIVLTPAVTAVQNLASKTLTATTLTTAFTPVTAAGGTPPYTFSVSPPLPQGLALDATTGAVSGVPVPASAATTCTITITDAAGATASSPFELTVNPVLPTTTKVAGAAAIVGADVLHPNGNRYDQVLLTGTHATVTAGPGKVTRTSFIDLTDDIVQVEISGAGTLSLTLDNSSGPAAPVNYNQPDIAYMKGHATLAISGADETTNVSVFSVGRLTAFDPTGTFNFTLPAGPTNNPADNKSPLFQDHATTAYDGVADIGLISIVSTNGEFGGVRTANASYFSTIGNTGVYAPGVEFTGPVYVGDIDANDAAIPVLLLGSAPLTQINGGDLQQSNNLPVSVSGITQLQFVAGITSGNTTLPAKTNKAVLKENGVDVTGSIVVNPAH
jgi:hypothetical protein